jgi:threonine dehydratase
MPDNSPRVKVDAVRSYGAEIHFCKPIQEARESLLQEILQKTGAYFIHPFNDEEVITGQATAAKELIEDTPDLDIIITPVGGGGLLSGTALAAHFLDPRIVVYAGEPEGAADAIRSIRSGKIEKAPYINTIADGLLTTLGNITFPIIQQYVSDIFTVNDEEIIAAMRLMYERLKIVAEPSCAVPLAAILKHPETFSGKRTGIIVSGGNVDLLKLSGWLSQ